MQLHSKSIRTINFACIHDITNGTSFFLIQQISDIKRLNKIEREVEIHARKTIKVPANAHSLLLNTQDELPVVHTSGQNSPKFANNNIDASHSSLLANNKSKLDEKLLVASVSLATSAGSSTIQAGSINDIILNSAITRKEHNIDGVDFDDALDGEHARLIDDGDLQSAPHAIRGAPPAELSCSGSDCDISWICLLVFILALCFAIPLIYVFYIAEHPEKFHHSNN